MRLVNYILSVGNGPWFKYVICFMDDLLIYSQLEDHESHLQEIFNRLRKYHIKLNGKKTQFCVPEVKFIGHTISSQDIGPDTDKIKEMLEYPRPKNVKSLRCFIGMCTFHKRYILAFSKICAVFNNLLRRDTPWVWSDECESAFQQLRSGLQNAPRLGFPSSRQDSKLVLTCDASALVI